MLTKNNHCQLTNIQKITGKNSISQQNDIEMNNNSNKKYKKPKRRTLATTNPQASKKSNGNDEQKHFPQPLCPLLAKDSEWINVSQTSTDPSRAANNVSDEEEVLQLVECEDGPEMKPLTIMFPGLLEKDQQTLEDMLNKKMSTTEVTKHLLGQKADFSLMKKVNRLIPSDKKWLESLSEDSNSVTSEMNYGIKFSSLDSPTDRFNGSAEGEKKSKIDLSVSEAHASTSGSQNEFL